MLFEFRYSVTDLLYDDYLFYKIGLNEQQEQLMKKRIISVLGPLYSDFGYIMEQLLSEEFMNSQWKKVRMFFSSCASHAQVNKWETGGDDERYYFITQIDNLLDIELSLLREEQESDPETAMARHLVYYHDVDFVVSHEFLKKDAYRLHSYCYDMSYNPEASYDEIHEDRYRDIFDYHFYCRTESLRTQVSFKANLLEEWDAERFERVQKLIKKMPGAYNQYFHPSVN